jgi:hypothetical protein
VSEVGMWLDFIECGEYKIQFIENSISGGEMFELEDEDLVSIGVKRLGHRKKILAKIKALQSNSRSAFSNDDAGSDAGSSNSGSVPSSAASINTSKFEIFSHIFISKILFVIFFFMIIINILTSC